MPLTLILTGSLYRKSNSSFLVYLRIGLAGSMNPDCANVCTVHWLSTL